MTAIESAPTPARFRPIHKYSRVLSGSTDLPLFGLSAPVSQDIAKHVMSAPPRIRHRIYESEYLVGCVMSSFLGDVPSESHEDTAPPIVIGRCVTFNSLQNSPVLCLLRGGMKQ